MVCRRIFLLLIILSLVVACGTTSKNRFKSLGHNLKTNLDLALFSKEYLTNEDAVIERSSNIEMFTKGMLSGNFYTKHVTLDGEKMRIVYRATAMVKTSKFDQYDYDFDRINEIILGNYEYWCQKKDGHMVRENYIPNIDIESGFCVKDDSTLFSYEIGEDTKISEDPTSITTHVITNMFLNVFMGYAAQEQYNLMRSR